MHPEKKIQPALAIPDLPSSSPTRASRPNGRSESIAPTFPPPLPSPGGPAYTKTQERLSWRNKVVVLGIWVAVSNSAPNSIGTQEARWPDSPLRTCFIGGRWVCLGLDRAAHPQHGASRTGRILCTASASKELLLRPSFPGVRDHPAAVIEGNTVLPVREPRARTADKRREGINSSWAAGGHSPLPALLARGRGSSGACLPGCWGLMAAELPCMCGCV